MAVKILKNTSPETYFRLLDGSEIKNVHHLAQSLATMSEDVFYSHLTEDKNDFANWIRDVYGEHQLADKLDNCKNQTETELELLRHILHKKK